MKVKDSILEGDYVAVNFNGAQVTLCHKAEVLYKPVMQGDSWHFRDLETGQIHYVSEPCTVSKIPKESELPF